MTRAAWATLAVTCAALLPFGAPSAEEASDAAGTSAEVELVVQRAPASGAVLGGSAVRISDTHALTFTRKEASLWERETGRSLRHTPISPEGQGWQQWHLDLEEDTLTALSLTGELSTFSLPDLKRVSQDTRLQEAGAYLYLQLSMDRRWALGVSRTEVVLVDLADPAQTYTQRLPPGYLSNSPSPQLVMDASGAPLTRLELKGAPSCWAPLEDQVSDCPTLSADPEDLIRHSPGMEDRAPLLVARGAAGALEPAPEPKQASALLPGALLFQAPDEDDPERTFTVVPGLATSDDPPLPLLLRSNLADRAARRTIVGPLSEAPVRAAQLAGEGLLYAIGPSFDLRWWLWSGAPEAPPEPLSCLDEDGRSELLSGFTPLRWTAQGPIAVVEDEERLRLLHAQRCEPMLERSRAELREQRLRFLSLDPSGARSYWGRSAPPGTCVLEHDSGAQRCVTQPTSPMSAALLPDGRLLERVDGPLGSRLVLVDLDAREERLLPKPLSGYLGFSASDDVRHLALHDGRSVYVVDLETDEVTRLPLTGATALDFSASGQHLFTLHSDGLARVWEVGSWTQLASIVVFANGDTAVVDAEGRLDYSEGRLRGLHFVFEGPAGPESIELEQLARYYFEPDLLDKLLDPSRALRPVVGFDPELLPPRVRWTLEGAVLHVELEDRGGGIGPVRVSAGGRELIADARPEGAGPRFEVDLAPYVHLLSAGELVVTAFDAAERVSGRGGGAIPEGLLYSEDEAATVDLFAVVIGTGEYADPSLSLPFADDDAHAIAQALRAGGEALLEGTGGRVTVTLLSTAPAHPDPARDRVEAAFDALADQAGPEDVLVVYLAGHGVSQDGEYHYPLPDATAGDLSDPALLQARALSYDDIMDLLRRAPAEKRLLILDTCESGGVIQGGRSELAADAQRRALAELRDRMGLFILAGAPAGRSAYESPALGHGLLTYVLLGGLAGDAPLEDGRFWDTSALLHHAVDGVPELARAMELGDTQAPLISAPGEARSFIIGARPEDPSALPTLRSLTGPPLVGGQLLDAERYLDHLELSQHMGLALLDLSGSPSASFRVANGARGEAAWRVGGLYTVDGDAITVELRLSGPEGQAYSAQLRGTSPAPTGACAARWTAQAIAHAKGLGAAPPALLDTEGCAGL